MIIVSKAGKIMQCWRIPHFLTRYVRKGVVIVDKVWLHHSRNLMGAQVPLFDQMIGYGENTAVVDGNGHFSYATICKKASILGEQINDNIKKQILPHGNVLCGERVAFLCANDVTYTVMVCAIWLCGGIAVPLCKSHPRNELEYVISDSQASLILSTCEYDKMTTTMAESLNIKHMIVDKHFITDNHLTYTSIPQCEPQYNYEESHEYGAMILYTSGTTGRPKGVLMTHNAISSQIQILLKAWQWSNNDCILHVLPLHHTHGIINVLFCSLWSGATCVMLPKFTPEQVWEHLIDNAQLNIFMAVPTIYSKLLQYYNEQKYSEDEKAKIKAKCGKFRLMVSGSSALPEPVLHEWQTITGIRLLERYGMTEFGMALSNPLTGKRRPGHVGSPLPDVRVKVIGETSTGKEVVVCEGDENGLVVNDDGGMEITGELYVKSPSLFKCYWNKPEATREAFTSDQWFKTGDTVAIEKESFKIVGRTSVDIIKYGGYKISALEVEQKLLPHPKILECVVVGVTDIEYGQRVAAVITCAENENLSLQELKRWAKDHIIPYHIPSLLKTVDHIPRNAMGKVNKKELVQKYFENKC